MVTTINPEHAQHIWFTADQHFGHANIIKFCDRPFATVEEMDAALIANWNKVVKAGDVVYHLGDFTLGDKAVAYSYFDQLNGNIRILSNPWHHDKRWLAGFPGTEAVELLPPMVVLEMPRNEERPHAITLCHYPLAEWERKHYNAWHIHGHSHGKHQYTGPVDTSRFIFDVGVDNTNYYPINLGGLFDVFYGMGWA